MQEIKVKNLIIGKQFEDSENLQEFLKIVKLKKINVKVVQAKDKINIEKNLYFDVIWLSSDNIISENILNNNALVCKLCYKNFTMLFTGDIEEIAEKELIKLYSNTNVLNVNVLKIAHHGSKSSSTDEFLELVQPKIALIGVGENNLYGHPNDKVLNRLNKLRYKNL